MRLFWILIASAGILFLAFLQLNKFGSAFEADQSCHYMLSQQYQEPQQYGCDHDLETRQWILYKEGNQKLPSEVIKRFRY